MENIIITYFLKVSIASTLFYVLYWLCLKSDTFNSLKRFYLLFTIIFSLFFPFLSFPFDLVLDNTSVSKYMILLPEIQAKNVLLENHSASLIPSLYTFIVYTILFITVLLAMRLLVQLFSLLRLRLQNRLTLIANNKVILLKGDISAFSFFKWIFIPINYFSDEEMKIVIAHEKVHADQYHSFDILLSELFRILFWWNPVSWLIKKEIQINLEYIVDQNIINRDVDSTVYQYLLLKTSNSNASKSIINNFNVSQLKKRITMINKQKTSKIMLMKYAFMLPLSLLLLGSASKGYAQIKESANTIVETETDGSDNQVYKEVEEAPEYPGGISELMNYIGSNLTFPKSAIDDGVEGKVVIRFVVSKTGTIKNVEIIKSLNADCDKEAIRVVENMPAWIPGKEKGKPVDVYYNLPILFKL